MPNKWYKIPAMVYVYSDLFIKIEVARGLTKRSTYIEVRLDCLINSNGNFDFRVISDKM